LPHSYGYARAPSSLCHLQISAWKVCALTWTQFERTVKASHDSGNFIVTARAPAISAEGSEAVSHFVYMMKYPLQKAKMMLFLLDRLAGSTRRGHDHNTFYVVELKETFDTR
jgi:hypothetical protein